MNKLKNILRSALLPVITNIVFFSAVVAQTPIVLNPNVSAQPHPRLLFLPEEEAAIQKSVHQDTIAQHIHNTIITAANSMTTLPPLQHKLTGKRLLSVSRECLKRIMFLGYAWRMTHEEKYKTAAIDNLNTVCHFPDWNHRQHFLDVAEMTLAVAIGYDWLYDELSPEEKNTFRRAILQFGLIPSADHRYNSWLRRTNNWNQVCNAGIALGALAVYEDSADFCKTIVQRSIESVQIAMKEAYHPEGAYPEGYGYWGYGTTYNVILIDALDKIFHQDFGLSQQKGFLATAKYLENMTGTSGWAFNYSDGGPGYEPQPAMAWFAHKENDPSLLWIEKWQLKRPQNQRVVRSERMLPLFVIWNPSEEKNISAPADKNYFAVDGKCPLALMRADWDTNSLFVGFKGGSPSLSHAHMDVGTFVLDAEGERWAWDLGAQDYYSLESKGVDLWNNKQNSQRWQIFRYNNKAHNTLTINDSLQRVNGFAKIIQTIDHKEFQGAVADLSPVYVDNVAEVHRGVAIIQNKYAVVRDELKAKASLPAMVCWTLVTKATASLKDKETILLSQHGKTLYLKFKSAVPVQVEIVPATPTNSFDAPNPGVFLIKLKYRIPAGQSAAFTVSFLPKEKFSIGEKIKKLDLWK